MILNEPGVKVDLWSDIFMPHSNLSVWRVTMGDDLGMLFLQNGVIKLNLSEPLLVELE